MALIKSWVIFKSVCKSNISSKAPIQKVYEELTDSLNGATESLTSEFSTAFSATQKLKKKIDYAENIAANDACRVCEVLKVCSFR